MKISNFHKIMVLLLMLIVSVVGFAQTEIDGHYYNLNNETKEAEFASVGSAYDHSTCTVIIPSTVVNDGVEYNVTGIGNNAFGNCVDLISVTIPNLNNS